MTIKAIVTDIEGTTSSIDFVHKVLFPYASEHLPSFIREHRHDAEVNKQLTDASTLANRPDADTEELIDILLQWIRDDNKATPLKTLQGLVWENGYKTGAFTGHVYIDVEPNLKKWFAQNIALYVYSSGSVDAQKLLFGYSDAGDLTGYFSGYFDTRIGNKRESHSYQAIVSQLGLPAQEILFLSDVVEELDAAASAGMHTIQLLRQPDITTGEHVTATNFNDIKL
jgi:enolase-phosphatase E1